MPHAINNDAKDIKFNDLSLKYLVRLPKTSNIKNKALILLHGVGSDENALFKLADQLPGDFFIITPRAPLTLSPGHYAWYNVDFSSGQPAINVQEEVSARTRINTFIHSIKQRYHFDEIYLGGFSQGAIMSISMGLTNPSAVKGILLLGGRILNEIKPLVATGIELKHLKVFLAHGRQDKTLPIHYARETRAYLESLHVQLSYHEYDMAHQVTDAVLKDINDWLR